MKNRQIDRKLTKQVRIESELHRLLKVKATRSGMSLKDLIEGHLANLLTEEDYAAG